MTKESAIAVSQDEELIPVGELQKKIRDFGKAYGFEGAKTISRALDLKPNQINRILHDHRITVVTGKTVREIETAIRHFNPRTSDETIIKGEALKKHISAWLKKHDLTITEGAKITCVPATTFGNWVRYPRDIRAGNVRKYLIAMQEYSIEQAKRLDNLDKYNSRSMSTRHNVKVWEKEKI